EDGIRDFHVTGVQTCALPILDELARRAGVVEGVAARRLLLGDLPHRIDGLAHADDGHALYGGGVELLELEQLGGARLVAGADEEIGRASCRERGWMAGGMVNL